jgi:hypothetical protein
VSIVELAVAGYFGPKAHFIPAWGIVPCQAHGKFLSANGAIYPCDVFCNGVMNGIE